MMRRATATNDGVGTTVDQVDNEALAEAARLLGTDSPRDTVNEALREVVRRKAGEKLVAYMSARSPKELENLRREAWR